VFTADSARRLEAEASAEDLLGSRVTVTFGDFEDGQLPYRDPAGVKEFLRSATRDWIPDVVIAPHLADRHQDHRFVADLSMQVFRDQTILGYELPKYDGDLFDPQVFVSLSDSVASAKLEHLDKHFISQWDKPWYESELFRGILRLRGVECRARWGWAEAFTANRLTVV
jgi:LmbE family N-acetylglucosaminyl deacetylase